MAKTYTTISGDEWDSICFKHYGSETVMDKVMYANPQYMHIVVFPAGVELKMPALDLPKDTDDLPPWMR